MSTNSIIRACWQYYRSACPSDCRKDYCYLDWIPHSLSCWFLGQPATHYLIHSICSGGLREELRTLNPNSGHGDLNPMCIPFPPHADISGQFNELPSSFLEGRIILLIRFIHNNHRRVLNFLYKSGNCYYPALWVSQGH